MHSLSRLSGSFAWQVTTMDVGTGAVGASLLLCRESESDASESSESMNTSARLYSLLEASFKSIPSVSLEALMTRPLLAWAAAMPDPNAFVVVD